MIEPFSSSHAGLSTHFPKPKIKLGGSLFNDPRPAVNPGVPSSVPQASGLSRHPARASVNAIAAAHQGFGVGSGLASAALGGGPESEQRQKEKKHKRERHADETAEDRVERKRAKKERKGEKKVCIWAF